MIPRIAAAMLLALIAMGVLQNFAAHLYSTEAANLPRSLHQGMEHAVPFLVPLALLYFSRKRSFAVWFVLYGTVLLMIAAASFLYAELFLSPDRKRLYFLDVYVQQWLLALVGLVAFIVTRTLTVTLLKYVTRPTNDALGRRRGRDTTTSVKQE